jgi:hypothetical protein
VSRIRICVADSHRRLTDGHRIGLLVRVLRRITDLLFWRAGIDLGDEG